MLEFDWDASQVRCLKLRTRILEMSQKVSALHIAGAFSCLEIVETIYFNLMRSQEMSDTFVMSKGHGCLAQYTALEMKGVLRREDLDLYCKPGGILGTHPDYGNPGIEASTGSLGHGLGMAMGMAYADRVLNVDRRVYVVLSDGELQEGSFWETVSLAPALKVNRLIAFVDLNDFQSLNRLSETHPQMYPLPEKLRSFGWESEEVNGHDSRAVYNAVKNRKGNSPLMVICRTTKGKGVSFMENVPIWHYRSPNPEEFQKAMKELTKVSQ